MNCPQGSTSNPFAPASFASRCLVPGRIHGPSPLNPFDGITYRQNTQESRKSFVALLLPALFPVSPLLHHSYKKMGVGGSWFFQILASNLQLPTAPLCKSLPAGRQALESHSCRKIYVGGKEYLGWPFNFQPSTLNRWLRQGGLPLVTGFFSSAIAAYRVAGRAQSQRAHSIPPAAGDAW